MFKSCVLLALAGVFGVQPVWSQVPSCEALVERAEAIRAMRDHDAAGGVELARKLLEDPALQDADCPPGQALLHAAMASNLHIQGQNAAAAEAAQSALSLIDQIETPTQRATVHRVAGVVYWEMDEHDRALGHYHRALESSRQAGDVNGVARTAGNIGNLHTTLGNWDEAERYHLEALGAFESLDWHEGIAGSLVNLGALASRKAAAWESSGEPAAARQAHQDNLDYNSRALELFEQLENPRGIAYASDNLARALVKLGAPDQALAHHERALALRREIGDRVGLVQSLLTGAEALTAMGDHLAAREVLAEALDLAPESNRALHRDVLARQIDSFARSQDFENAFRLQQRLADLQRAAAAEEVVGRVEELEARYRSDQLEQELALQRARAEVSEQRAGRQRLISLAATVTALLLLVIVVLVYNRYRLGNRASKALDRAARTDPLTGLSNRRDMHERIDHAIARCESGGEQAALIMADIDSFKRINDTLGHQVGDAVLRHVSDLIRGQVRGRDVSARWGGEEFLLLLPDTGLAGASQVAENIRRALSESPPMVDGRALRLTMTFGVTELQPGADFNGLLKQVDEALYAGKARGKDRVVQCGGQEGIA